MTFGQWLRIERERAELSQEQLGAKLGCTRNTIQNIESGRTNPRFTVQKRALEFFGVALPWDSTTRVFFESLVAELPRTGTDG